MIATIRRYPLASTAGLALGGLFVWAALAPVHFPSREEIFEIPKGTWARRMRGDPVEILPSAVYLTLGVRDVLLLRNQDEVPQVFGPTLMMPGQSFRLPFELASEYQFACTAHASGQMTVVVHPRPDSPWRRLHWRAQRLWEALANRWAHSVPAHGSAGAAFDAKDAEKSRQGREWSGSQSMIVRRFPSRPLFSTLRSSRPALLMTAQALA